MSFFAHKLSKTKRKIVNRSSIIFRIKNALSRKKARIISPRTVRTRPETHALKRKIGLVRLVNPKVIRILIAAVGFALLSAVVYGAISIVRDPMYAVDNFEIIGNNSYPTQKISEAIGKFKGQSLFLINTGAIAEAVRENYVNLLSVDVKKIYPNKISILITEKEVRAVLININGAYLIDEDSLVINVLTQTKINYTQARLDLLSGFADQNSPLIQDVFLQKFIVDRGITDISKPEQDKIIEEEFNFDSIPPTDKLAQYNKLKAEIQMEVDALTGEVIRKIQTSDYNTFPQIIVLNNEMYQITNTVDKKRLDLTLEVLKYFSNPLAGPTVIGHVYWKGQMLIEVPLSNGTRIIFGVLKKASYQLEDYEIIVNYLITNGKTYKQIDLSSNKIAVK